MVTGNGGADRFVLGETGQVYYDDGNARSANNGKNDYALITDFLSGIDTIQLAGELNDYHFEQWFHNGVSGTGIFHDTNGDGVFDLRDELIGLVAEPGQIDLTTDLVFV